MNISFDSIVLSSLVALALWVFVRLGILKSRAARAEAELKSKEIHDKSFQNISERSLDDLINSSNDDRNKRNNGA